MKIKDLTPAELEKLKKQIAAEDKKKASKQAREREKYEASKDKALAELTKEAKKVRELNEKFKSKVALFMDSQREKLNNYGGLNKRSKGGFSILSTDGRHKISVERQTQPKWDERAQDGVQMIAEFLIDQIKPKSPDEFDILMELLARDKDGNLQYNRVMMLLSKEQTYSDPRWVRGLALVKEGYLVTLQKFQYNFFERDEHTGELLRINPNFSAI